MDHFVAAAFLIGKSHVGLRLSFLDSEVKQKIFTLSIKKNVKYAQVYVFVSVFRSIQTSDWRVETLHTYLYCLNEGQV